RISDAPECGANFRLMTWKQIKRIGHGATLLLCVAISHAAAAPRDGVSGSIRDLSGNNDIGVKEDDRSVTVVWECPGADWQVTYCIVGSTRIYWNILASIRDNKIDITGRQLNFVTRMHRHTRDGKDEDIILLAASWDGNQLMRTDWRSTSI